MSFINVPQNNSFKKNLLYDIKLIISLVPMTIKRMSLTPRGYSNHLFIVIEQEK